MPFLPGWSLLNEVLLVFPTSWRGRSKDVESNEPEMAPVLPQLTFFDCARQNLFFPVILRGASPALFPVPSTLCPWRRST